MYDPNLGRFVSPDSIVPGAASGKGGGAATLGLDGSSQLTPLTVDFHEPGFIAVVNGETAFRQEHGFWFQLSDEDEQQAKSPWGPANPQALNRYSYVLNNPLRYTDPTGHCVWDLCIVEAVTIGTVIVTVAGYTAILYYNITHPITPSASRPAASSNTGTAQGKQNTVVEARKGDIKFIDRVAKKYNLTREQRRELHDEITNITTQGLWNADLT
jgi:hypothetical protein